ncbi:MAG TPA: hypothetical protein PK784_06800 [Tenuifilaceae bacterium]|nr:hypothetical protein [Tenuifilaceae bacterium]HPN22669.1 hypothetical protein [Tenuifilaceae bacterium]
MLVAILKNNYGDTHLNWAKACDKYGIKYNIIDLVSNSWLAETNASNYDLFLACPPGREDLFKKMYDERIFIIERVKKKFVYPSHSEIILHENKKFLSYWLESNAIPHPRTSVFYNKSEALEFVRFATLPIVGKMNIGASGKGVVVFRDKQRLIEYIETAFSKGIRQAWGPNTKMGGYGKRLLTIIKNPQRIIDRVQNYKALYAEVQRGFVLFQEYVPHKYEWRIVRIGDSYFGHQKVKQGDKASGTKGIDYVLPPDSLLNFVRDICERFNFNSMSVDLFDDGNGGYLVNEMQCIFGHVQDYICEHNGEPGRLTFENNEWSFEKGFFNSNLSYDLRLENALHLIAK